MYLLMRNSTLLPSEALCISLCSHQSLLSTKQLTGRNEEHLNNSMFFTVEVIQQKIKRFSQHILQHTPKDQYSSDFGQSLSLSGDVYSVTVDVVDRLLISYHYLPDTN
jgi:hypothetical protein